MRANPAIPEAAIRFIVGNFSVGASDEKVADDIRSRGTKAKWPKDAIAEAVKFALKVHHENQDLYRGVMSGRLRNNPKRRARRNPSARTTFKRLPVGAEFRFASEKDFGPASGLARGPWKKISDRKYVHAFESPAVAHRVGSASVEVLKESR